MKKTFLTIFTILVFAVSVFLPMSVNAIASSIHVTTVRPQAGISWYIEDLEVGYKTLDDGSFAYCLDYHLGTPLDTTVTLLEEMDSGVAYIIENGYPNKSFTGNGSEDYYITQVALWWYLDEVTGSHNLTDANKQSTSPVIPYAKALVDNAKVARANGYQAKTISASFNSGDLNIVGNYFVSEEIIVSGNVNTYTVELVNAPSGSYVTDVNGNKKTSFNIGENFKVYVPFDSTNRTNSSFSVKLNGVGTINKVYRYKAQNVGEQDILPSIVYPEEKAVSSELMLNVNYPDIIVPDTNSNLVIMYIIGSLFIALGIVVVNRYVKEQNK